jgi:hypothetical protein
MKGYFSQLARHTGLTLESGKTSAASSALTASTVVARHERSTPMAPLHVEEVAFTGSSPVAAADISERSEQGLTDLGPFGTTSPSAEASTSVELPGDAAEHSSEARDAGNPEGAPQTTPHAVIRQPSHTSLEEVHVRYTASESKIRKPQAHTAKKQISASRQGLAEFSAEDSQARQKPGPPELLEIAETAEGHLAGQEHLAGQRAWSAANQPRRPLEANNLPGRVVEQTDAPVDEQSERDATFQNYLKEVRAWVAAPPEVDGGGFERERPEDAQRERSRGIVALDLEMNTASSSLYARTQEPEVQDLNLSIGTISVVIEEPKQGVPSPPLAPPRAERTTERATSEPTSLSRYYLRSW